MINEISSLDLWAVFAASIIGSWHCAGMCGPFSLFLQRSAHPKLSQVFYHLGRLTTYLSLVLVFHKLGEPLKKILGNGFLFIFLGIWVLAVFLEWRPNVSWWARLMHAINKIFGGKHVFVAAFGLGLTTTLLPCIWLYGFIILAISKESLVEGFSIIFAFWLGTLPALLGVYFVLGQLSQRVKTVSRKLSAALLMVLAVYFWISHGGLSLNGKNTTTPSCPLHKHASAD